MKPDPQPLDRSIQECLDQWAGHSADPPPPGLSNQVLDRVRNHHRRRNWKPTLILVLVLFILGISYWIAPGDSQVSVDSKPVPTSIPVPLQSESAASIDRTRSEIETELALLKMKLRLLQSSIDFDETARDWQQNQQRAKLSQVRSEVMARWMHDELTQLSNSH